MTSVPRHPQISELRELFRNLQEFRAVYENTGVEEIVTPLGNRWSLWDLEYLYSRSQELLTDRQRQAVSLCLVHNMREQDAAVAMGVSPTNPVMMYATLGIRNLLNMIEAGDFERFHKQDPTTLRSIRRVESMIHLASEIKERVKIDRNKCWIYPHISSDGRPRLCVRTVYTSSGLMTVNPFYVMYEAYVGSIPPYFQVAHTRRPKFSQACVNPSHGELVITEQGKERNRYLLNYYRRSLTAGV